MPAIGCRIDEHVRRCNGDRAVEHHLERLVSRLVGVERQVVTEHDESLGAVCDKEPGYKDRQSTRLNSSHGYISYAVFCLKNITLRIVLIALTPSHPPRNAARLGSVIRVTLGVIFAQTGFLAAFINQPTTSSTISGFSHIA